MPLTLNGTTGIAGVDGSASTPAAQGSDTNTGVFYPATYTVGLATNGTERARVSSDGTFRVKGAGTAGSTDALQISGSAPASTLALNSDGQTVLGAGTASLPAMSTTGDLNTGTFYPAADTIGWTTGGSERARIDSSGNLVVGNTTTPSGNASHILSSGSGSNRGSVILQRQTASTSGVAGSIQAYNGTNLICSYDMYADGANNSGGIQVFTWNAGSASAGPYVSKGGTSWTTASDETLKDIIEPIENGIEKVSSLRSVIGKFKTDSEDTRRVFMIAQDVQKVLPEAVNTDRNGKLGLNYQDLIPLAIAALQELSAKLEAAEARIAALEAK